MVSDWELKIKWESNNTFPLEKGLKEIAVDRPLEIASAFEMPNNKKEAEVKFIDILINRFNNIYLLYSFQSHYIIV